MYSWAGREGAAFASGLEWLASRLRPEQERVSRACCASAFLKYSTPNRNWRQNHNL
jgi:hypothetical protein